MTDHQNSSAESCDADKGGLVEELDIYIRSAERYERGDADFQKSAPAGTLKVLRAEINALARLRETYADLYVQHQNIVASRDAWRSRAEELGHEDER